MHEKWKRVIKQFLHLLFPEICLHCNDLLDGSCHFCIDCLSRIQISKDDPCFMKAIQGDAEVAYLLEKSDLSGFIHSAIPRLDLSFLSEIMAPLYYYKACLYGWEEFQVLSDDFRLKKHFANFRKQENHLTNSY